MAKQLNSLCLICNISRDRGNTPPATVTTTTGDVVKYHPGGVVKKHRPYVSETRAGDKVSLSIQARDKNELRKILKEKRKKFPTLDIEEALSRVEVSQSFPDGMYHFELNFGNEDSMRSIVKALLATVFDKGISPNCCNLALRFLRGATKDIPVGYFYERDLIASRPKGIPLHCVYIMGCSDSQRIVGYIEFFGVYRMVALLSVDYIGEAFEHYYAIDPISGNDLTLQINFDVTSDEIQQTYNYEKIPEGTMEAALSDVLAYAQARNFENEREAALTKAIQKGFQSCGAQEGDDLTEEQMRIVSDTVSRELAPLLFYHRGIRSDDQE